MTVNTNGPRLGRRLFLRGAASAAGAALLAGCASIPDAGSVPARPESRLDRMARGVNPELDVTNVHTGERMTLRLAAGGRSDPGAMRQLDYLFRDWRVNEAPAIDERIYWSLAALAEIARQDGQSGRVELLSGFRSQQTNHMLREETSGVASNSFHTVGRAADIRLEGVEPAKVAAWAEWLQIGGVGRYPRSGFTHVDSGPLRGWVG